MRHADMRAAIGDGADGSDQRQPQDAVLEQCRRGDRMRSAARHPDDGEAVEAERIGQRFHVIGRLGQRVDMVRVG